MLRVLIVDDEEHDNMNSVRMLRRWGHSAGMVHDADAALSATASEHSDVVLLNMDSDPLGECQVARKLRLHLAGKDCLIIAVTGRTDGRHRRQCAKAGIDLFLMKPVDPSVVETLLVLECIRINRLRPATMTVLAATGSNRSSRQKPSGDP